MLPWRNTILQEQTYIPLGLPRFSYEPRGMRLTAYNYINLPAVVCCASCAAWRYNVNFPGKGEKRYEREAIFFFFVLWKQGFFDGGNAIISLLCLFSGSTCITVTLLLLFPYCWSLVTWAIPRSDNQSFIHSDLLCSLCHFEQTSRLFSWRGLKIVPDVVRFPDLALLRWTRLRNAGSWPGLHCRGELRWVGDMFSHCPITPSPTPPEIVVIQLENDNI